MPFGEQVVVAVEDERLAEEGTQDKILAGVQAKVGAQEDGEAAGDTIDRAPGGEWPGGGRASQPGAIDGLGDPGIGPGGGDGAKAAGVQRSRHRFGEALMGWSHDAVDGDAGAALEVGGAAQGLGEEGVGLGV